MTRFSPAHPVGYVELILRDRIRRARSSGSRGASAVEWVVIAAIVLMVLGIAWIAYYYIVVRVDPSVIPAPEPGSVVRVDRPGLVAAARRADCVLELVRVHPHEPAVVGQVGLDMDALAQRALEQVGHALDQPAGGDALRQQRLVARESE